MGLGFYILVFGPEDARGTWISVSRPGLNPYPLEGNHWTTREVPGAAFLLLYLLGVRLSHWNWNDHGLEGRLGVWTGLVKTTV